MDNAKRFPNMTDQFGFRRMTKAQAADYLGMSERTLQRRHSEGKGPPRMKIGGIILYSEESLIRWLKAHEIEPVRLKC